MIEKRCEWSDLPETMCAHCRGLTLEDNATLGVTQRFTARRGGRCPNCKNLYRAGDRIGKTTEGEYICGTCAQ